MKYYKVIQQHYGQSWEDCSQYETNSTGTLKPGECLQHDLKEYKLLGYPTRVIIRREKQ
jgi:hypothetical protein